MKIGGLRLSILPRPKRICLPRQSIIVPDDIFSELVHTGLECGQSATIEQSSLTVLYSIRLPLSVTDTASFMSVMA